MIVNTEREHFLSSSMSQSISTNNTYEGPVASLIGRDSLFNIQVDIWDASFNLYLTSSVQGASTLTGPWTTINSSEKVISASTPGAHSVLHTIIDAVPYVRPRAQVIAGSGSMNWHYNIWKA